MFLNVSAWVYVRESEYVINSRMEVWKGIEKDINFSFIAIRCVAESKFGVSLACVFNLNELGAKERRNRLVSAMLR